MKQATALDNSAKQHAKIEAGIAALNRELGATERPRTFTLATHTKNKAVPSNSTPTPKLSGTE